ncbi:MAG: lysyl oxidase family protein, partial [Pirellulales bacterium]
MRSLRAFAALAFVAHGLWFCCVARAGDPVNYLYPDMFPYVEEDAPADLKSLQAWELNGTTLQFSTLFANQGDGLFEIRKGATIDAARYELLQRVYINNDFGSEFVDIPIGTAPIPGTPGSPNPSDTNVIWFEDFTRFSLLEAPLVNGVLTVGNELTFSQKTSWRLSSNHGPLPGYSTPNHASPDQRIQQRVSVGWADMYGAGSSGQYLDITGIPAGPLYWLRQNVDPENRIHETNETNNSYEILIDLNRPGEALMWAGTFVQPGDPIPPDPGDLNEDGVIDTNDWAAFKAGANTSLAGLSKADAYVLGDLNLDGLHSLQDVVLFRQYYEGANGAGSFASLQSVPEPATLLFVAAAGGVLLVAVRPRRPKLRRLVLVGLAIAVFLSPAFIRQAVASQSLYVQNFDGLTLGPNVDESLANAHAWTDTPPAGWTMNDSGVPFLTSTTRGVTEWKGWSFANKTWWSATAGNQGRGDFALGQGTVAVADPDEWDDKGNPINGSPFGGYYNAFMTTPAISLSGASAGSVKLSFDSSWLPECCDDGPSDTNNQTAAIRVSYNGGSTFTQVMRWESNTSSPSYKPGATNESVTVDLQNPAGASSVIVEFGMINAGNDWWWAIDNLQVFTPTVLEVNTTTGQMSIVGAGDLTGYEIKSTAGSLNPTGWKAGNLDAQNFGPPNSPTADFSNNNVVDAADYSIWRDAMGSSGRGDANGDGAIDQGDYLVWRQQYGQSLAAGQSWETLIASNKQLLEFYLEGSSNFASKAIGLGYNTAIGARDLSFTYSD